MRDRQIAAATLIAATLVAALWAIAPLTADEGLYPFHNPPRQILKERYGFEPTDAWLDHLRLSSVRFNSGGSGSFISPNGLVLTNHHVGLESIHKLSTPERDFVEHGMWAETRESEPRCPDLELNVLIGMEDVTGPIKAAIAAAGDSAAQAKARREAIGAIESASREATGLRSNVVELYRGGEYWLYQYKQYTDVRLVFAPEGQIGFYGGDPDNFTYPRFNLDFAIFRVYEDGQPAQTPNYLQWNPDGVEDGDLVFVSGNPGRTSRLITLAQLKHVRDISRPRSLDTLATLIDALVEYGNLGEEQARQAMDTRFSYENSFKAYTGQVEGLADPGMLGRKEAEERELRAAIRKDPELANRTGDAFQRIEAAMADLQTFENQQYYRRLRGSLFGYAQSIVRFAEEMKKPSSEREPAYRDSSLDSFRLQFLSSAPVYPAMDEALLRASLELGVKHLPRGAEDPFLARALDGESPAVAAKRLISGTTLADPSARERLLDGGADVIQNSDDPMIALARAVDPMLRELEKKSDAHSAEVADAAARIAEARFAVLGNTVYPDATFTLRLSFGTVKGYEEDTTRVPWKTTFYGLYERANAFSFEPPYDLPNRYLQRESRVDLATPLNFVHTCDIIGGNSGSPTLNRAGELVGLVFDGNIQSLPNDFIFAGSADRAVSVHAGGILEALRKLYRADALADEILGLRD